MDLGVWLRGMGLEQYEAAFRQNDIDATVLPNLTADDLKDLGIGSIGHPWILEPSATELYVKRICTSLPRSLRIA
jgi:hypothetical protein